jgi:hypothetical protein
MEVKTFIIVFLFILGYILIIDLYKIIITLKNKIIDYVRKKRNRKKSN